MAIKHFYKKNCQFFYFFSQLCFASPNLWDYWQSEINKPRRPRHHTHSGVYISVSLRQSRSPRIVRVLASAHTNYFKMINAKLNLTMDPSVYLLLGAVTPPWLLRCLCGTWSCWKYALRVGGVTVKMNWSKIAKLHPHWRLHIHLKQKVC